MKDSFRKQSLIFHQTTIIIHTIVLIALLIWVKTILATQIFIMLIIMQAARARTIQILIILIKPIILQIHLHFTLSKKCKTFTKLQIKDIFYQIQLVREEYIFEIYFNFFNINHFSLFYYFFILFLTLILKSYFLWNVNFIRIK